MDLNNVRYAYLVWQYIVIHIYDCSIRVLIIILILYKSISFSYDKSGIWDSLCFIIQKIFSAYKNIIVLTHR